MPLEEYLKQFNKKAIEKRKAQRIAHGFDAYSSRPHLFSNQNNYRNVLSQLKNIPSLKIFGKCNVAIMLGEGYLLSSLPELSKHVDTIILMDIDKRVLINNLFMLSCFRKANTPEEFFSLYFSDNPIINLKLSVTDFHEVTASQPNETKINTVKNQSTTLDKPFLLKIFRSGVHILDADHFLDPQRFIQCKAALEKLTFFSLEADVLDEELMKELSAQLITHNVRVRIFNITNLFDYEGNYPVRERRNKEINWQPGNKVAMSLASIIDRPDDAVILYSVTAIEHKFDRLVADMACSLTEYQALCSQYAAMINTGHKIPKCIVGHWEAYANQFKVNLRATAKYGYFNYNLNPTISLLDNLKQFVQSTDGLCFLRSASHGLVDAVIKTNPDLESNFIVLLEKYQIAHQKRHISIVITDIYDTAQKDKILIMINTEKSLMDNNANKMSENLGTGGSGRKIYK